VALLCGLLIPGRRSLFVLRHALSEQIHVAEFELSIGVPGFGLCSRVTQQCRVSVREAQLWGRCVVVPAILRAQAKQQEKEEGGVL
jgi:hypothetical protein